MPYGDGTGPVGSGPLTGRGAGFCAGFTRPGFANPVVGRFFGFARGGRGYRNWYYATGLTGAQRAAEGLPSWGVCAPFAPYPGGFETAAGKEEQVKFFKNQAGNLTAALDNIKKRIKELERDSVEE